MHKETIIARHLLPLIAIAALPLAAHAQSSLTIYGLVDVGVALENRGAGNLQLLHNLAYPSRIGFRGREDLGGGLSANFVLEGDVAVDTGGAGAAGTGLDFARVAVVGLRGPYGELQLGRSYTPGFLTALNHDNLSYGFYNSLLVFTAGAGGIVTRYSNGLFYISPNLSGLNVRAAVALGERAVAPKRIGDAYGVGATYKTGTVTFDAYHQVDQLGVPAATPTASAARSQTGAGVQWKGTALTLVAGYGQSETDGLNNKSTGINFGATMPVGAFGEVLAHVVRVKTKAAAGTNPQALAWGLTYRYQMSKRTTLYATTGQTRNNATGVFPLFSTKLSAPAAAGADPRGFGVGVMHRF